MPGLCNDDHNDYHFVHHNFEAPFFHLLYTSCMAHNPAQMGSKAGTRGLGFLQDIVLIAAAVCINTSTFLQLP